MSKKQLKKNKPYKNNSKADVVNDTQVNYSVSKKIHFFQSFEEEKEFEAKKQASLSYEERMHQLEKLRKIVYKEYLQEDGTWKPLIKKITILKP